jgi:hypothetical protein
MQSQSQPGWSNPKVLTIFALIFLCGTAFGCVLTRSYLHGRMHMTDIPMEQARRIGLQRLKAELDLSADQERFITQELDDYSKYYQNIEDERRDVAEHGKQRILDRLTDAQKRKFNDILGQTMRAGQ